MATMNAKDAISASLAECYVTIKNKRYQFMQAIDLEATFQKIKKEVPILGKPAKGNKSTGVGNEIRSFTRSLIALRNR